MPDETHPILLELANQVATALSQDIFETWCVEPRYTQSVHLVRMQDGLKLGLFCPHLWNDTQAIEDKRIEISGVYPANHRNETYSVNLRMDEKLPAMSVAGTRTPAQIATDIRRRLLAEVEHHTTLARQWVQRDLERHQNAQKVVERLCQAGDGAPYSFGGGAAEYKASHSGGGRASWTATVYQGSNDVYLDLRSVPAELAIRIVELIVHGEAQE